MGVKFFDTFRRKPYSMMRIRRYVRCDILEVRRLLGTEEKFRQCSRFYADETVKFFDADYRRTILWYESGRAGPSNHLKRGKGCGLRRPS
jgi:hypothetical protein